MTEDPSPDAVALALESARRDVGFTLRRLPGGANNRAYRIDLESGPPLFLKQYFRHPLDTRNRLEAEFGFSTFAASRGVRRVAAPVARNDEANLGIYEFIEGAPLAPLDVTPDAVDEASRFLAAVNAHRSHPEARLLPDASESAFSIADHLRTIGQRVERLDQFEGESAVDREAARFVHTELVRQWTRVANHVRQEASDLGFRLATPLEPGERILSPSDFGFHNAIRTSTRGLVFHDFEYAGWDDAAKTVCDFFCQPTLPAPIDCFETFARQAAEIFRDPEPHLARARLLFPAYQVKWATILMNEFLPAGRSRREFAETSPGSFETRKADQLARAGEILDRVVLSIGGRP